MFPDDSVDPCVLHRMYFSVQLLIPVLAQELEHRLDRRLEGAERARIGVTQLRRFLEQLLQRRSAL